MAFAPTVIFPGNNWTTQTVTGSAATSIVVTGLDFTVANKIEMEFVQISANAAGTSMRVNPNSSGANLDELIAGTGFGTFWSLGIIAGANAYTIATMCFTKLPDGRLHYYARSESSSGAGSGEVYYAITGFRSVTTAVTSMQFLCDQADIAVNSYIRWRYA